jgi:hypothetical protein
MIAFIVKLVIYAGILYGYYWVALRNKVFHSYNRFYLLSSVVLSAVLPLLSINFGSTVSVQHTPAIKILNAVSVGNDYLETIAAQGNGHNHIPAATWLLWIYIFITILGAVFLVLSVWRIFFLLQKFPANTVYRNAVLVHQRKGYTLFFF